MATRAVSRSSTIATPGGAVAPGLTPKRGVHWNLGPAQLFEAAVTRAEGQVTAGGAFNALTTPHTGRSPNDKCVVKEPESEGRIWWGKVNQPLSEEHFRRLYQDLTRYLSREELLVRDLFAGADAAY